MYQTFSKGSFGRFFGIEEQAKLKNYKYFGDFDTYNNKDVNIL